MNHADNWLHFFEYFVECHNSICFPTFNVLWVSVCIEENAAEFMSEQEIMFQKE